MFIHKVQNYPVHFQGHCAIIFIPPEANAIKGKSTSRKSMKIKQKQNNSFSSVPVSSKSGK